MVKDWKKQKVEEVEKELKKHSLVGIVKIEGIPSKQVQILRKKLRGRAKVMVTKKTLFTKALDKTDLKDLGNYMGGSIALILSNEDSFKLNRFLETNKSTAAAKAGQVAPDDIIVKEGDTGLPAGPAIGDVQGAGIPCGIDKGKIIVKKTITIVKKGDKISAPVATALSKLKIEPIHMGFDIVAVKEGGIIYKADVLHIDVNKFLNDILMANQESLSFSINVGLPVKETIKFMLQDCELKCKSLALNAGIITKDTAKDLLAMCNQEATRISG